MPINSLRAPLSALAVAATLAGMSAPAEAGSRDGQFVAGAITGLAAGMILGGVATQASPPRYYYEDDGYYQPPRRYVAQPQYYYEPAYRPAPRKRLPQCESYLKYDYQGRPYEWKDCN